MSISINDFKTNFNGGTRQNRFVIKGQFPSAVAPSGSPGSVSEFHVRATQIPALSTLTMEYNYFGRKAYYPGEKQYSAWSVAVIDDTPELGNMWKMFHRWQNYINNHITNDSESFVRYKVDGWEVQHLDLNGNVVPLKSFKMFGVWPRTIMDMPLNMANPNSLNQFTVVFVYDYIELYDSGTQITTNVT